MAYFTQLRAREHELRDVSWFLDMFPQHFTECEPPGWEKGVCPYRECCFQPWVRENPIASSLYKWREPHHEAERATLTKP